MRLPVEHLGSQRQVNWPGYVVLACLFGSAVVGLLWLIF